MNFARFRKLSACFAAVAAAGLTACGGSPASYSPAAPASNPAIAGGTPTDAVVRAWSRSLVRVPLPSAGCFVGTYPALAWSRIACGPPMHPPRPRSGRSARAVVGDGNDYALSVNPRHISTAIGSFPQVTGVKRVKTIGLPIGDNECVCGSGNYTLQLNTNFYPLAPCGTNHSCQGWEQLVFSNPTFQGGTVSEMYIQDWRIATHKRALTCPSSSTGWSASGKDCYYSSAAVNIPPTPISQLGKLTLSLSASRSGDSGFFAVGTTVYGMKDIQGDFSELSTHWTAAEFNVFGDCCASRAIFNSGSTIAVSVEADDGSKAKPKCLGGEGTTGETNSLSFVAPPSNPPAEKYPSILFAESNVRGGGTASCDVLAGL
jgi:hypothetical protein